MKKLLVSLLLVFTAGMTSAFGNGKNIDPLVEKLFTREFPGAENVKWVSLEDGYQKASFTLAGIGVEAYFSPEAELAGTVRNLFYNQLPLVVIQTVNNRFAGSIVLEVREITNSEGTSYRIRMEKKEKRHDLYLNSFGEITGLKKIKRKK